MATGEASAPWVVHLAEPFTLTVHVPLRPLHTPPPEPPACSVFCPNLGPIPGLSTQAWNLLVVRDTQCPDAATISEGT